MSVIDCKVQNNNPLLVAAPKSFIEMGNNNNSTSFVVGGNSVLNGSFEGGASAQSIGVCCLEEDLKEVELEDTLHIEGMLQDFS